MAGSGAPNAASTWPEMEAEAYPMDASALVALAPSAYTQSSYFPNLHPPRLARLPSDQLDAFRGSFAPFPPQFMAPMYDMRSAYPQVQHPSLPGPAARPPWTSFDSYIDYIAEHSTTGGRAVSLPIELTRSEAGMYPARDLQPATPTPPPSRPEFRTRLLNAMPMGRSASFTAGMPDTIELQRMRSRAETSSEVTHRLKNRDAQRRFRQRQRESICEAQKAVKELAKKLENLNRDVQQERVNAQIIMESLLLENLHIKSLAAQPEVRAAEQLTTLKRFGKLVSRLEGDKAWEAPSKWLVEDWVNWIGSVYMPALKELLAKCNTDAYAGQLLKDAVLMRRQNLARIARFSCWHWVLYAWNVEALQAVPEEHRPSLEDATRLLEALKLSAAQEDELLQAHRRLRQHFELAFAQKQGVLDVLEKGLKAGAPETAEDAPILQENGPSTGNAALCTSSRSSFESQESGSTSQYGGFQVEGVNWGPAGPALRTLRRFLEGQRWAAYSFLYTILDLTLTVEQEAALDSLSYPFLPDWHTMLCALQLQRKKGKVTEAAVAAMALPNLSLDSQVAAPLLPVVTPANLLLQPMMGLGMGIRLTYGILLNPYHTIDEASLWKLQPRSKTSAMTIFEAVAGSWETGLGAPLYWLGLGTEDQLPSALEAHEKCGLKKTLNRDWEEWVAATDSMDV